MLVVHGLALGRERNRHPECLRHGEVVERRRHHPDDDVRAIVDADGGAEHRGIGGIAGHEQTVAEDRHAVGAGPVFLRPEGTPEDRGHAEDVEEAVRDLRRQHTLGRAAAGDVDADIVGRGHVREHVPGRRAPVDEVAGRDLARLTAPDALHQHDAIRLGKGQRTQDDRVDDAEDGGGGTDAKRDGEHGRGGKAGRLAKLSQRRDRVLPEVEQPGGQLQPAGGLPVDGPDLAAHVGLVAERARGLSACGRFAHARLDELGNTHLDVKPDLVVGVPVRGRTPQPEFAAIPVGHGRPPTAPSRVVRWPSAPSTRPRRSGPSRTPRGAAGHDPGG
jgi:hypothetical protein